MTVCLERKNFQCFCIEHTLVWRDIRPESGIDNLMYFSLCGKKPILMVEKFSKKRTHTTASNICFSFPKKKVLQKANKFNKIIKVITSRPLDTQRSNDNKKLGRLETVKIISCAPVGLLFFLLMNTVCNRKTAKKKLHFFSENLSFFKFKIHICLSFSFILTEFSLHGFIQSMTYFVGQTNKNRTKFDFLFAKLFLVEIFVSFLVYVTFGAYETCGISGVLLIFQLSLYKSLQLFHHFRFCFLSISCVCFGVSSYLQRFYHLNIL